MRYPDDVKKIITKKFQRHHKDWLKESGSLPININLDTPTEKQALNQKEDVQAWIASWRAWENRHLINDTKLIIWTERNWRMLGTQNVPEKLVINTPEEAASLIGKSDEWSIVVKRYKIMVQQWNVLKDILAKQYKFLSTCDEVDFHLLINVVKWLCDNPNSNLYPRQIPVQGIDTKWLESHKGLVTDLVKVIKKEEKKDNEEKISSNDFFKVCGLKTPPQLIRIRILDSQLRIKTGGLYDISIPWDEAVVLDIKPACVFIVENLQTGLAFHDLPCSVVIMGLGYNVENLSRLPWLFNARCIYWGDIDTHGFSILNRARNYLPALESILMDEATLLAHRQLWVKEEKQSTLHELPLLTNNEQKLYSSLKTQTWGQNIRLEQERICWGDAWEVIKGTSVVFLAN